MSVRKNIPECPSAPVASTSSDVRIYEIELITPLFGGGVSTRVNDSSFPIRPTSIRGQLQFWWRATVGAQYATKEELRKKQSEVWGDTSQASRVQIRVDGVQTDEPRPCARFEPDHKSPGKFRSMPTWNDPFQNSSLPYALFPFQGQLADKRQQIDVKPASCIHKAKFRLIACCKGIDFASQVEPAIWAWVNFGGLGSRTRRGCGALFCKSLAPKEADDLKTAWKRYMPALSTLREWPTLAAEILVDNKPQEPIDGWDATISLFKHFRQGVGMGRNGDDPKFPKRSFWPEPESVRAITGQRLRKHEEQKHIPKNAFPRSEFGLPIVFHFKDEDRRNADNIHADPRETKLYPKKDSSKESCERMASPLILKPLALQNGKAVALILRLQTPTLTGVDLRWQKQSLNLPQPTFIRDPKLAAYHGSPMQNLSPSGSALDAFLAFARTEGFTEISR